ncbi:MAG: phosphoadenosine phosphosulfate reductase family protein [Clostridia bacterium]|nr:phosphoadenosine phosphosulfate reductase family protein [Clostridia bacterium]MDD3972414.1 phosphoadenosine phosphosulfate reductase family protein [Clostridia bacterium]
MPDEWREMFEMWADLPEYADRIKKAENNIRQILITEWPVVLYSGGKDSLVLLHMVMKQNDHVPVYYSDSGYDYTSQQIKMPKQMTDDILKIGREAGAKILYSCGHRDPNSRRFFGNLFRVMKKHECTVELLGIRGGESSMRDARVKGPLVRMEGNRRVAFPLRNLDWRDIWAYLVINNIRYLDYYDKYAAVEGGYDKVRLTSRFSRGMIHKGGSYYIDGVMLAEYRNEKPGD